jgi:cholesterol transport system auxiliary component
MIRPATRLAAAAALALALGGCITLFPKETPEGLYRFGSEAPAASGQPARYAVLEDAIGFDRLASTDRILTVDGDQVAYISGGRWAVPAPLLFDSAVQRAFDGAGGPDRLITAGSATRPDFVLKLDVLRFEARYDQGPTAPPTVVIRLHAALNRGEDHAPVGDRTFEVKVPASDNRIGAIATGFDQATTQVLSQVVAWVAETGT